MNEKTTGRESRLRRERLRQTALRSWGMYLLALVAWVAAVLGMTLLCAILCSSVIWQSTPLYWFLQWVKNYIVLVMGPQWWPAGLPSAISLLPGRYETWN